jgi:hypothetical protein
VARFRFRVLAGVGRGRAVPAAWRVVLGSRNVAAGFQVPWEAEGCCQSTGRTGLVLACQGDRDQGRTAGVDEYLVASGEFDIALVRDERQEASATLGQS